MRLRTLRRHPVYRMTYRMIAFSVLVGIGGAFAALVFDTLCHVVQQVLLEWFADTVLPASGGEEVKGIFPSGAARLWIPAATTLGGLLSGLIVFRFAPEASGHGTDAAISAYHQQGAEVRGRVPVVKAIASALTIGSGGVAGREGPTAQISVGIGTAIGRLTGLRGRERRFLMLASMAAGLAAMFRAPLGMAIFSVEIIYAGMVFEGEALIYTIIAAVTSYAIYGLFAGWDHLFAIPDGLTFDHPEILAGFAVLGLLAGVMGAILPWLLYGVRDAMRRVRIPPHFKPAIGGLAVGIIALAVPEVLGTGYGSVQAAILGQLSLQAILLLLLLKPPAMALTIGSGGAGGVFAPTVTMGALLGAAVGLGMDALLPGRSGLIASFAVVGMAAVFAGAARTPISTLIMVAEMTGGYGLIVPAMLANVIAFLVQRGLTADARYPTLYESQVESREDSPLHKGVLLRRAVQMLDTGSVDPEQLRLPRLVSLLRYRRPIRVSSTTDECLVSVDVDTGSKLDGTTVAESIGGIEGVTAVAVLRGRELLVPRGSTELLAGDTIVAIAGAEASRRLSSSSQRTDADGTGGAQAGIADR
jgi:CIC family chloride channel protein